LAAHSTKLVLPTMPTTWSSSTSFLATVTAFSGSHPSSSTWYSIGRPLMPPFAFTQSK